MQNHSPGLTVREILIADEVRSVRVHLSDYFVKLDYQVDTAEDAHELNLRIQSAEYAVILLSCGFSGDAGLRLLSELSASHPTTSIVMMSDHPRLEKVIEALRRGAVDFVIKPLEFDELSEIVHKAYDRYELQKMHRVMSQRMRKINDSAPSGSMIPAKPTAETTPPAKESKQSVSMGETADTVG
jgi:DNA-binding NtrC family response regulator